MVDQTALNGTLEAPPRVSEWRRFRRVFLQRRIIIFGIVVLSLLVISAAFAPWLAPYNPYLQHMSESLQSPSRDHLLGTDVLGYDTLSRLIYGARTALLVGFVTVGSAAFIGVVLGILAGYLGGITNMVIMRCMDALMGFPMLLLALLIDSVLGGGIQNVIISLAISTIPGYTRLMCSMTLSVRENDYVLAEKSIGSGNFRTMFAHILPNAIQPIIVLITLMLGNVILAEAGLSFLGIGIKPPGAAWGAMVSDGYQYMLTDPIISIAPGVAIMVVVFAFNIIGDGLRDAMDPRLRGTL